LRRKKEEEEEGGRRKKRKKSPQPPNSRFAIGREIREQPSPHQRCRGLYFPSEDVSI
jgi:hypothetical protein